MRQRRDRFYQRDGVQIKEGSIRKKNLKYEEPCLVHGIPSWVRKQPKKTRQSEPLMLFEVGLALFGRKILNVTMVTIYVRFYAFNVQ